MEPVNPADFIISRKRKLYKFALFRNSPLCYEFDALEKASDVDVVEVGAGNAHFLVELAQRHPKKQFVALDVKGDRLQSGAAKATEKNLTNIRFIRARADQINELFKPATVAELWLTFSDPFPRKRNAGRRMSHPTFLKKYQAILRPGGDLLLKHDNPGFFRWSLEQLVNEQWQLKELAFDLHESELNEDYKVLTAYEQRWLTEGLTTQFVRATRP